MAPKAEKAPKAPKKASGDKKVSAYNLYIKEEIPKIKAANPGIEHMAAFKTAAANWSKAKGK